MRVIIDPARCLGNALCESVSDGVLELGEDGVATYVPEAWDESRRGALEQAVRLCPTQAISIEG